MIEKRMTSWSNNGHGQIEWGDGYTQLAKYEDSDLTPEEVKTVKEELAEVKRHLRMYETATQGLTLEEIKNVSSKVLYSRAFGYQMTEEEFTNLENALKDKRVLILPYKVGDTIYTLDYLPDDNRLTPIEVYLSSLADVINTMFSRRVYYKTFAEAQKAIDTTYLV